MSAQPRCRSCGQELPPGTPDGLCPACLLRAGLEIPGDAPPSVPADLAPILAQPTSPLGVKLHYFGDYELLEEIARGGMGVVFKARQVSLNRIVAVKLIQAGCLATRDVMQRFQLEAEAAARLDHPNIVPIYEVGQHQGHHYFSMKLVEGGSLSTRISNLKLRISIRDAAKLLATVARAVHYAHQRGILHRDLKPGNILLDAQGEPHITDFGLAKLLESDSNLTVSDMLMGTPTYMSPEQAAGRNRDLTTASDLWSLGVILYQLLTGQPPFRGATPVETLQFVKEQEPVRPRVLNPGVDRDLETMCLKCLRKVPNERYGSAEALAEDLTRWQAGEPIMARPTSPPERFWRWCRRKPAIASLAAAVVLTLMAGVVVSSWYAVKASRAEKAAQADRQKAIEERNGAQRAEADAKNKHGEALKQKSRADGETATAKAVNDFLQQDLLQQANPETQASEGIILDPNLTVRTAVDRAAQRIGNRFTNQPLVEASIRMTLANTYHSLGEYDAMKPQAQRASELREKALGPEHFLTLAASTSLADALHHVGQFKEAISLHEKILEIRQRLFGPDHPDTLHSKKDLAVAYEAAGRSEQALPLFEQNFQWWTEKQGAEGSETLGAMSNLALAYRSAGKFDLALPLFEKIVRLQESKLGPDHPDTLNSMNSLAVTLKAVGKLMQALPLYEKTLERRKAALGPDHPHTFDSMNNFAVALEAAGQIEKAVPLYEETLKRRQEKLGLDHADTLRSMNNLAGAYLDTGKLEQALPMLEQVLKLRTANPGPEHPRTLNSMNSLAVAYKDAGKLDLAVPLFEKTLKLRTAKLGREHADTMWTLNELALAYETAGEPSRAEPMYREKLAFQQRKFGSESLQFADAAARLGSNLYTQKNYAEAEPLLREALAVQEKKQPEDWETFNTRSTLGGVLLGQQATAEAEPLLRSGYEGMMAREARIRAGSKVLLREALNRLVRFYETKGDTAQAGQWRQKLDEFDKRPAPGKSR